MKSSNSSEIMGGNRKSRKLITNELIILTEVSTQINNCNYFSAQNNFHSIVSCCYTLGMIDKPVSNILTRIESDIEVQRLLKRLSI